MASINRPGGSVLEKALSFKREQKALVEASRAIHDSLKGILNKRLEEAEAYFAKSVFERMESLHRKSLEAQAKRQREVVREEASSLFSAFRKDVESKLLSMERAYQASLDRIESMFKALTLPSPEVQVKVLVPQQEAPVVNFSPEVNVPSSVINFSPEVKLPEMQPQIRLPDMLPPEVTVNVPQQAAPSVHVEVPKQEPSIVNVTVPKAKPMRKSISYDQYGLPVEIISQEMED